MAGIVNMGGHSRRNERKIDAHERPAANQRQLPPRVDVARLRALRELAARISAKAKLENNECR